jgi:uncharacterized Ntn-hydrolase superfamily protein
LRQDPQREQRQVGVVCSDGKSATYTGTGCNSWAGGDSWGQQSAALIVKRAGAGYGRFTDQAIDLRVDDHA